MREENQCKIIGWLILIISLAMLAAIAASGCQMVHGAALDIESASRYVADHTVVDR